MFKKVTYTGFENQPALLAKVQGLLPTLNNELDIRLGQISIEWRCLSPSQLELRILDDVIGEVEVGVCDPAELDQDPRFFHAFVWSIYLDSIQKHRRRRILKMQENQPEPVGA